VTTGLERLMEYWLSRGQSAKRQHLPPLQSATDPNSAAAFKTLRLARHLGSKGLRRTLWAFVALTLMVLLVCGLSRANSVTVTVVFTNRDRLTGTLEGLDGTEVRFRPEALRTLGNVLNLQWHSDALAELDLGPGCIYLTRANQQSTKLCFQSAVVQLPSSSDRVSITTDDGQTWSGATSVTSTPPRPPVTTGARPNVVRAVAAGPPSASSEKQIVSMWSFGLNAPESAVNATQSSQNLGGSIASNVYFGDPNHLIISASGTHQHNYSSGKSIKTDIFDSIVQFGHTFDGTPSRAFTLYQVGEWFFNTSLGMAAQRSVGGGIFLPAWRTKSENFSFKAGADLRYFDERLYSAHSDLALAGSRFRAQAMYRPSDRKWFISATTWINPMWNNEGAWQGYADLTLSFPFGNHICLDFTPADDEYLENAPHGDRKNYLSSTATLKISAGPNPGQTCTQ
jgi:hypothetical protein